MRCLFLYIICEGETEIRVVKNIISPHLREVYMQKEIEIIVKPIGLQGHISWDRVRGDLLRRKSTCERKNECAYFSSMIDFYALLADFPGNDVSPTRDHMSIVSSIESALSQAVGDPHFIPYIQLHELEALVFCDVDFLADYYFLSRRAKNELAKIMDDFHNQPEKINRGPSTSPSKRLKQVFVNDSKHYDKIQAGSLIPMNIGMARMMEMCPHFSAWITSLENLEVR